MSDEKIVTEQVEEKEEIIDEAGDDKAENEEVAEEKESEQEEEQSDDETEETQEEQKPDPVAAQLLAELQKIKAELAEVKSGQSQKSTDEQAPTSYLEANVASRVIEEKIKSGNIQGEHAQFYRQLGGLIDQINATNTEKIDKAISSFGGAFQKTITRLRDIDYRGFKRTYGESVERDKLDSIIKASGDPFMTYGEAMQKSVLADPKMLGKFLAAQRNTPQKNKTSAKPPIKQIATTPTTAKFREYLVKGTNLIDTERVDQLPFDQKSDVLEAWGTWFDKNHKGK